ncbi:hypothetical protein P5673_001936 [Acropora cervicornis]|uniref:Uncharacterized protein n=1 Tax=Acropora cervicornis TaxID=6130 RepID=A0AAD9R4F1_ACRCE|nr:hypothetical protein P5673_001936 [Acropora cervicornis]
MEEASLKRGRRSHTLRLEEPKYDTVEPIAKSFPKINNFHAFRVATAQDDLKPLFTIPESNSHEIVASKTSGNKLVRHFVFPCENVENPSKCVGGDNDLKRSCDKNKIIKAKSPRNHFSAAFLRYL